MKALKSHQFQVERYRHPQVQSTPPDYSVRAHASRSTPRGRIFCPRSLGYLGCQII